MIILEKNLDAIAIGRDPESPIAICMFYSWNGELHTVLVRADATEQETMLLRKIAYQYAEIMGKKRCVGVKPCDEMLDVFQECFDDYLAHPDKELVDELYFKQSGCFIKNVYNSPQEAIAEIIRQVKDKTDVSISIDRSKRKDIFETTMYTVSLTNDSFREFTFWNYHYWPQTEDSIHNLHIVPGYHPSSPTQGKKLCGLSINGATDALIGSSVISMVYSPLDARKAEEVFALSSWEAMKHPCKAVGKSFDFTLHGYYYETKELVDAAVELILTALGAHPNGYYMGVVGGFAADFPEDMDHYTGIKFPEKLRGSEQHCVWTYAVLKEEEALEEAYIPKWFYEENWVSLCTKK